MADLTIEQIDGLYDQVHKDEEGTANVILNAHLDEAQKSAVMVMLKVARESSLEDFRLFVQEEEMPPMTLSDAELAAVMGGGEGYLKACAIIMVGLEFASMCMSGGGGNNNGKKKSKTSGTN